MESNYIQDLELTGSRRSRYSQKNQEQEVIVPSLDATPEETPIYKKKPTFIDKSYFSIIMRDLMRKKPIKGLKKAGVKFLYENSEFAKHIIENPGGEEALNDIYVFDPSDPSKNGYTWLDKKLLSLRACEGTRRRRMVYKNALSKSMEDLCDADGNGLNLIELGSGRGSISMEAVYNFIRGNGSVRNDLHLVLVDKDMEALEKAKGIAEANGLSDNTRIRRYNVKNVSSLESHNNFHIAGTHGLLDYFSDEEAVGFFRDVGDILVPKGHLVTTNMMPHDDWVAQKLMETFGNWMLIYRTPEEFRSLIEKSGRYEILDTKVVTDNATYTLNSKPIDPDIKGFHVIATAKKKD